MIRIGTAGWAIPRQSAHRFADAETLLSRYATRFNAAEINSTFYRSHRASTYSRWAAAVPEDFRFAVKAPKAITHERRLVDVDGLLEAFLDEIRPLETKLGPILVQLPPSLAFDGTGAERFFASLRQRTAIAVACEPRHPTWFDDAATRLLTHHRIARVAADPARVPDAALPGAWPALAYFRLHGSPRMYFSPYERGHIRSLAGVLAAIVAPETWCIFDNTGSGSAAADALALIDALAGSPSG